MGTKSEIVLEKGGHIPICPLITIGVMRPIETSKLVGVTGETIEAASAPFACMGPACAVFVPNVDRAGHVTGGNCGLSLGSAILSRVDDSLSRIAAVLERLEKPGAERPNEADATKS